MLETKAEFARRVGVTRGRISQLIAKGLPVTPEGKIDPEAGLAWLEQNLDHDRRGKGGVARQTTPGPSLAEARRLLLLTQVQRARLALERERGDLVDAAGVTAAVLARARLERDAWQAWVTRAAPELAAELGTPERACFATLDRLVRAQLAHLAETPLHVLDGRPGAR
jgi:hypothetical protein